MAQRSDSEGRVMAAPPFVALSSREPMPGVCPHSKKKYNQGKRRVREMLLIELFSGTGSVGKVARRRGWKVISVDNDPSHNPTHVIDIMQLPYKTLPVPDFVWASPPCTTYSHAANWVRHREPGTGRALSGNAKQADRIVRHTMKMIK